MSRPAGVVPALKHQLRLFFVALQFFTRIPIPQRVGFDPEWLHHAARYFPAVGLIVGLATASAHAAAAQLWPPAVAVLLSTALGVLLTGAFHEDGFADVCDGMGGGYTAERTLEIMKDSRVGAFGAIGIMLMLALKIAALGSLPAWTAAAGLLAAHPLSRLLSGSLIRLMAYARHEGKAKPLATRMSNGEFAIAVCTGIAPLLALCAAGLLAWQGALLACLLALCGTVWMARIFLRRLGGYTGDCLGAVQQVAEVLFYLGLLALAGR
jgi:adenosylcobinamide-GDP ribazoletransferase